jgi:DNA repair protein RadD
MKLREHQQKAIDMMKESFRKGNKRIILGAPCSFGKTIVSAYMLKQAFNKGHDALFICDRIKLVDQTIVAFNLAKIPFGVLQGNHDQEDLSKSIQIASAQTLVRRDIDHDFKLIVIDECHIQYKKLMVILKKYPNAYIVGLSATPFSKGLGDFYTDLIVPITANKLLDQNYLCPIKYYSGQSVNVNELKKFKALPTGGTDFHPEELARLTENDKTLTGHIVDNWLAFGENKQTIAFSPSIKQSRFLVAEFMKRGIKAEHIDGYMKNTVRRMIFSDHNNGQFKILSCSRLLNTGYDEPSVACLLDLFPTKSKINLVQRYGRVMRIAKDKPYAIILDHASNVKRHGLAEDVVPSSLNKSEDVFKEERQLKKTEKKTHDCPKCKQIFTGMKCSCGYVLPVKDERINYTEGLLREVKGGRVKEIDFKTKSSWYSDLKTLQSIRGYKRGWADNMYRNKFNEEPSYQLDNGFSPNIQDDVKNFVTSQMIRYAFKKRSKF